MTHDNNTSLEIQLARVIIQNQERLERKINFIALKLYGSRFWDEWGMGMFEGQDAPGDTFK